MISFVLIFFFSFLSNDYVDFQRRFTIKLLDGYQVTAVHNQSPFLYIGKDLVNGSYPNLNIIQTKSTEKEFSANTTKIVSKLKTKLPDYNLEKKERFSFQDSNNGLKIIGTWTFNNRKLKNIQYYFMMNGFLYIVTGTTLEEQFDRDLHFFKETTMSIRKISLSKL